MPMFLIEGLDLAGKSTVVELLLRRFRASGLQTRHCRNALVQDNPVAQMADGVRRAGAIPIAAVGTLYVASHAFDLLRYQPPAGEAVHLQDSSWLRSVALHRVHAATNQESLRIAEMLKALLLFAPRFDRAVFLTASLPARRQRLHTREQDTPEGADDLDRWVVTEPERFIAVEQALRAAVHGACSNVLELDTTSCTAHDVAEQCWSFFTRPPLASERES